MANKKNNAGVKVKKSDNSVVYKVMVGLLLLCIGLVALRALRRYYPTMSGLEQIYPMLPYLLWGGFGLCLAGAAAWLFWKKPVVQLIAPWFTFLFGMVGMTALSMRLEFTDGFYMLYFIWGLVFVQYIIYQLYRWDFFFFSLPTVAAGFLFFQMKSEFTISLRNMVPLVIVIASLICTALVAAICARNKGCLTWGKKRTRMFPKAYTPFLHYVVVVLWVICVLAAFILGDLFAFYCMFAAIAVEFIAAVYYTFQLN